MTLEKIKSLFPIEAEITQEIIDNSDWDSVYNCPGANTLGSVLPNEAITWGQDTGSVWAGLTLISVTTENKLRFADLARENKLFPQKVKFILKYE